MAIAARAIAQGYSGTAHLFYPEVTGENESTKGRMLLEVFEGFVFSKEEEISFAAVESIGRMLYYESLCFPKALASCLLRYFDSTCSPRPYAFLDFFFNFYPATSSINQHKMIGAIRHALRKLHEAEEDCKALTNVEANKMMNFVAAALRKSKLFPAAEKKEIKEVYPPQFFLIRCFLDWVIDNPESYLCSACVGALVYTSPEEFGDDKKTVLYLRNVTSRCINVLYTHELDKLVPMVRRFERRLTGLSTAVNACADVEAVFACQNGTVKG